MMHLKDKGTHTIEVCFSGSGDDGGIDDVYCYDHASKNINIREKTRNLDEIFYRIIHSHADTTGDWINNEGGYGTLTINLEDNSYEMDLNLRCIDSTSWDEQIFI